MHPLRTITLTLILVALSGCKTIQYRLPAELANEPLVHLPARSTGYGEWSRARGLSTRGTFDHGRTTFKLAGAEGEILEGECERRRVSRPSPLDSGDPRGFRTGCTVLREEHAVAQLTAWWEGDEHRVATVVMGEALTFHPSRRLETREEGRTIAFEWVGALYGYDIEHGARTVAAVAYVGRPGLHVRQEAPGAVQSAVALAATLVLVAHDLERSEEVRVSDPQ